MGQGQGQSGQPLVNPFLKGQGGMQAMNAYLNQQNQQAQTQGQAPQGPASAQLHAAMDTILPQLHSLQAATAQVNKLSSVMPEFLNAFGDLQKPIASLPAMMMQTSVPEVMDTARALGPSRFGPVARDALVARQCELLGAKLGVSALRRERVSTLLAGSKPMHTALHTCVPQTDGKQQWVWAVGSACFDTRVQATVAVWRVRADTLVPDDNFRGGVAPVTRDLLESPSEPVDAALTQDGTALLVLARVSAVRNAPRAVLLALDARVGSAGAPLLMLPRQRIAPAARKEVVPEGEVLARDLTGASRGWLDLADVVDPVSLHVLSAEHVAVLAHTQNADGSGMRPVLAVLRVPSYDAVWRARDLQNAGLSSSSSSSSASSSSASASAATWSLVEVVPLAMDVAQHSSLAMGVDGRWALTVIGANVGLTEDGREVQRPAGVEFSVDPVTAQLTERNLQRVVDAIALAGASGSASVSADPVLATHAARMDNGRLQRLFFVETADGGVSLVNAVQAAGQPVDVSSVTRFAPTSSGSSASSSSGSSASAGRIQVQSACWRENDWAAVGFVERIPGSVESRQPWMARGSADKLAGLASVLPLRHGSAATWSRVASDALGFVAAGTDQADRLYMSMEGVMARW